MKQLLSTVLALTLSVVTFSQSTLNLKFNLDKEKVYKMKSISNQNIVSTYNGNAVTTVSKSAVSISYKLISQDNDMMSIEFRFDTIQSKTTSPMGNRETNSAIIAKKTEYLEQLMNRFSTYPIVAKISKTGKFSGFENYKLFRDNIILGLDSVPENKKNQIQKQIDMVLKESAIQSMIEPLFAYMPDKSVKTGDQWETSYSLVGGGVTGMIFNTITLGNLNDQTAQLNFVSELESMPNTDENANMSFDINGNSTGTMTIDIKTGLIINHADKKKYSGTLTIKNQGNEMKIPMVIDSQSEIYKQ
ncbi:MAG: DUF6263 family protein [Paludibacter sp.]